MLVVNGVMAAGENSHRDVMGLTTALLVVTWVLLAARAVHAEAAVGDRQFWLTRPYDRRSLMAAKALLLIAAVHTPMFIAQAVILVANGFSIVDSLGGLLWEEVLLAFVFTIPEVALASVTDSFPRFLISVLGSLAAVLWVLRLLAAIPDAADRLGKRAGGGRFGRRGGDSAAGGLADTKRDTELIQPVGDTGDPGEH